MISLKIILYVTLSLCLFSMSECHPKKSKGGSRPSAFKETLSEKELSKLLLSSLNQERIQKRLVTILGKFEGFKRQHLPNQEDHVNQWVFATPLSVVRKSEKPNDWRVTYKFLKDQYYTNFNYDSDEKREKCNDTCEGTINNFITRITTKKTLRNGHNIHTEVQMLYRDDDGKNLLKDETYRDKVILVYSEYIPCSQNQRHNGGVFAECAGEMAAFRAMREKNINNNYFIVIYKTVAKDKATVIKASQLYMEMGGIPLFQYNRVNKKLTRYTRVLGYGEKKFITNPVAIRFPRPLSDVNHKFSKTQLYVDCLAWNNFLLGSIGTRDFEFQSTITKKFMYDQFAMDSDDLVTLRDACLAKKLNVHNKVIAKSCYHYVEAYAEDGKKEKFITDNKQEHYYTALGFPSRQLQNPNLNSYWRRQHCPQFLGKLNQHFNKAANFC